MGLSYSENVSVLVGPQWTLGEWCFVVWAALMTILVCLMFVWWMAVRYFDPEDFEGADTSLSADVNISAITAPDPQTLRDWVEVR